LENYWAVKILQEAKSRKQQSPANPVNSVDTSQHLLHAFPYHQNYIDLSRLECSTLEGFLSHPPTNVAFIGSGPLPLTSICMLDRYPNVRVCNIDRDAEALRASQELCSALGNARRMSFACEDIALPSTSGTDWSSFDVVFLAALVGMDTGSKLDILTALAGRMGPGSLVVARSAWGLRGVLYPVGSAVIQAIFLCGANSDGSVWNLVRLLRRRDWRCWLRCIHGRRWLIRLLCLG
jgi:nicotianamine synthase